MSQARQTDDALAEMARLSRECDNLSILDLIDAVVSMTEIDTERRSVDTATGAYRVTIQKQAATDADLTNESEVDQYYLTDQNLVILDLEGDRL